MTAGTALQDNLSSFCACAYLFQHLIIVLGRGACQKIPHPYIRVVITGALVVQVDNITVIKIFSTAFGESS